MSPEAVDRCCMICGERQFELIHLNQLAPLDGIDLSTSIGLCEACGHLQAYRMAPVAYYEQYYRQLSKTDYAQPVTLLDEARISATVDICQKLSSLSMTVADIGCGSGDLLARLSRNGFLPVLGLDPSGAASAHALRCHGLRVVEQGFISDGIERLRQAAPDMVFLMAVLEHLCDARADLQQLAHSLKPGAMLILEVPALEGFDPNQGEPLGEFSIEHIQFFSTDSLTKFVQSVGLELLQTRLVTWPNGVGSSLYAACQRPLQQVVPPIQVLQEECRHATARTAMKRYAEKGRLRLENCLAKIPDLGSLVIYGAGSHTARILPMMSPSVSARVVAVIDGNPNLHGKRIGPFVIEPPHILEKHPNATVIISSYRSQEVLARYVAQSWPNILCRLYPPTHLSTETNTDA